MRQRVAAPDNLPPFPELVVQIGTFLMPVLKAARSGGDWLAVWKPGGPWENTAP